MKKVMFIGPRGAGKSTLSKLLKDDTSEVLKTVVPEYYDNILDTPGEYMEHPKYYGRFQVLSSEYEMIGLVVSCLTDNTYISPNFIDVFFQKDKIGIITKTDLCDKKDIDKCRELLRQAGVSEYYEVSIFDKLSIKKLSDRLK